MARKKTTTVQVNVKAQLSGRLREIRLDLFGDHGGPELARRLNLPARTWYNYETGVTVPAEVLLAFIDQTGTNPVWLLSGVGEKFSRDADTCTVDDMSAQQLIRRGLEKLEEGPGETFEDGVEDYVPLSLVPLASVCPHRTEQIETEGQILADRQWIPNPSETVAARLEDDAMAPILPRGSVVAIDVSNRDPSTLAGRLAVACVEGNVIVRWLELSGRHLILRPNQVSREFPLIPFEFDDKNPSPIIGVVVWSWSRFGN